MQIFDPVWTSSEIQMVLNTKVQSLWFANGLQIDSRAVVSGDIFVALRGEETDGHQFVVDAFKRGAVAAIVSDAVHQIDMQDPRLIHVDDTYQALVDIAQAARRRAPVKTIAVTGSVGKTSVVQALRKSLDRSAPTHASIKSFNNHVGVPLSLSRMDKKSRIGVFELGMSGEGEIEPIAAMVQPDVAIITAIGAAHRQSFKNLKDIATEKAAVFKVMAAGSTAIIGMGHDYDEYLCQLAEQRDLKVVLVGFDKGLDVFPERLFENHQCSCLSLMMNDQLVTAKINQPGREWVLNAMLVLAATQAVDCEIAETALTLASLRVEKGRGRLYHLPFHQGDVTVQDDSYNANPVSMRAALKRFSMIPCVDKQTSCAVLGDMAELGSSSALEHQNIISDLKDAGISFVYAVGPMMCNAMKAGRMPYVACKDARHAYELVEKDLKGNERLFIKGSNAAGLSKVVDNLIYLSRQDSKVSKYSGQEYMRHGQSQKVG